MYGIMYCVYVGKLNFVEFLKEINYELCLYWFLNKRIFCLLSFSGVIFEILVVN